MVSFAGQIDFCNVASYTVSVSREIPASTASVYALLADYVNGHPSILPKPYFKDFAVLEGGVGEGTRFRVEVVLMGKKQLLRMIVSEPEPGTWLRESDLESGTETNFRLEPGADGHSTFLTIDTVAHTRKGLMGWMEGIFGPLFLRKLYRLELEQIHQVVGGKPWRP